MPRFVGTPPEQTVQPIVGGKAVATPTVGAPDPRDDSPPLAEYSMGLADHLKAKHREEAPNLIKAEPLLKYKAPGSDKLYNTPQEALHVALKAQLAEMKVGSKTDQARLAKLISSRAADLLPLVQQAAEWDQ